MVLTHGEVAADDAPAASPVLRTLVLFEHALFLLLVSVGFLRALLTGATPWPVVAGTFLLIAWYAVGARRLIRPPLAFLALLGAVGAKAGGANIWKATARVTFWGALALAVTAGIGKLFGVMV